MQIRMSQINAGGFSWNASPGTFNPYLNSNPYAGAPSFQQAQTEPVGQDCYTCTNPDTGDTQYGVASATASQLKSKGYRCRKDDCANKMVPQVQEGVNKVFSDIQNLFSAGGQVSQDFGAPGGGGYTFMSGPIPLAPGLGRRALR